MIAIVYNCCQINGLKATPENFKVSLYVFRVTNNNLKARSFEYIVYKLLFTVSIYFRTSSFPKPVSADVINIGGNSSHDFNISFL